MTIYLPVNFDRMRGSSRPRQLLKGTHIKGRPVPGPQTAIQGVPYYFVPMFAGKRSFHGPLHVSLWSCL